MCIRDRLHILTEPLPNYKCSRNKDNGKTTPCLCSNYIYIILVRTGPTKASDSAYESSFMLYSEQTLSLIHILL